MPRHYVDLTEGQAAELEQAAAAIGHYGAKSHITRQGLRIVACALLGRAEQAHQLVDLLQAQAAVAAGPGGPEAEDVSA